ncbi:hypothetical protein O9992_19675 [Vibrio lentus]|nr:hypothetical protein [Vibrio lentus]
MSEPKTITITVTGSNDAPVAKTDRKRPKKTRYWNGNVPAATTGRYGRKLPVGFDDVTAAQL